MKKTHKQFVEEVNELDSSYEVLDEYSNSYTKIRIKHNCGNIMFIAPKHFLEGQRCKCEKDVKYNNFRNKLIELNIEETFEYISGFDRTERDPLIKLKCKVCGSIQTMKMYSIYRGRLECYSCNGKTRRDRDSSLENLNKIVKNIDKNYEVETGYLNGGKHPKVRFKHNVCNNVYEADFHNFKYGFSRCPYCTEYNSSKNELELLEFIKNMGYKVCKLPRKDKNWELDIYLPDLKIGFEYNGLYWHSQQRKQFYERNFLSIDYHRKKQLMFNKQGIKVYYLWEHWGLDKCKSIIVDILNNKLDNSGDIFSCDLWPSRKDLPEGEFRYCDPVLTEISVGNRVYSYYDSGYWKRK